MTTFHTTAKLRTVATGKGTVNVSVEIARGDDGDDPNRIDEVFTNAELDVRLEIIPKDVQGGQEVLDGIEGLTFAAVARTNTFSTSPDSFTFGMSFKKTPLAESELCHFAHSTVKLKATRTGTASDQAGEAAVGGDSLYDDSDDDDSEGDGEGDEFGNDEGDVNLSETAKVEGT